MSEVGVGPWFNGEAGLAISALSARETHLGASKGAAQEKPKQANYYDVVLAGSGGRDSVCAVKFACEFVVITQLDG